MHTINKRWWIAYLLVVLSMPAAAKDGETDDADSEFIEFLGSMGDEADAWEEFMDIAADDSGPLLAETDYE
jgi:hypothetical protein